MKLTKMNVMTFKWIVSLIIAIHIGTWMMELLYDYSINVRIARSVGVMMTASIGLLCLRFWINTP